MIGVFAAAHSPVACFSLSAFFEPENSFPNASLRLARPKERAIPSGTTSNRLLTGDLRRRILGSSPLYFLSFLSFVARDTGGRPHPWHVSGEP